MYILVVWLVIATKTAFILIPLMALLQSPRTFLFSRVLNPQQLFCQVIDTEHGFSIVPDRSSCFNETLLLIFVIDMVGIVHEVELDQDA